MSDLSIFGVLILGLIGGGLLGYLVGGLRRELVDRNLRLANTRLRSLELDRDLLSETLEITRRELDEMRKKPAEGELVVVLGASAPAQPMPPKSPPVREQAVEAPPIAGIGSRSLPPVPKRSLQEVIDRIRAIAAEEEGPDEAESAVGREAPPDIGSRIPPVPKRSLQEVIDRMRAVEAAEEDPDEPESVVGREALESDELADDAGSGTPQDVSVKVEEPDPSTPPDLDHPKVRFG